MIVKVVVKHGKHPTRRDINLRIKSYINTAPDCGRTVNALLLRVRNKMKNLE